MQWHVFILFYYTSLFCKYTAKGAGDMLLYFSIICHLCGAVFLGASIVQIMIPDGLISVFHGSSPRYTYTSLSTEFNCTERSSLQTH